jgi:hypothetical protein
MFTESTITHCAGSSVERAAGKGMKELRRNSTEVLTLFIHIRKTLLWE